MFHSLTDYHCEPSQARRRKGRAPVSNAELYFDDQLQLTSRSRQPPIWRSGLPRRPSRLCPATSNYIFPRQLLACDKRESQTWNARTLFFHLDSGMQTSRQSSHGVRTPPSKTPNENLAILASVMQFSLAGLKCTCMARCGHTFLPCPSMSTHSPLPYLYRIYTTV